MNPRVALPIALVSALACLGVPSPARGEHLRFEVGDATPRGVPESFDALVHRVEGLELVVTWQEPPVYDPYFASSGGATFGSITCTVARGSEVTLSWIEFADVASAVAYEQELAYGYGISGTVRWVRGGRIVLQAYSLSGTPEPAADLLQRIVGG